MSLAFTCTRDITIDKSADEVWDYPGDLRNVMTTNQLHLAIEAGEVELKNPSPRTEVRLLHEMMGHRFYRIARVLKCED